MFPYTKFLRITLPVATGACAIVATSLLISWTNDKDKLKKDENDEILKDLEKNPEEFKEEVITKPDNNEQSEEDSNNKQDKEESKSKDKNKDKQEADERAAREELKEKILKDPSSIMIGEETVRKGGEGTEVSQPSSGTDAPAVREDKSIDQTSGPEEQAADAGGPSPEEDLVKVGPPEVPELSENVDLGQEREKDIEEVEPKESESDQEVAGDLTEETPESRENLMEETEDLSGQPKDSGPEMAGDQEEQITSEIDNLEKETREEDGEEHENSDSSRGEQSAGKEGDSESGSAESPLTEEQLQTFLSYQEATERTIGSLGKLLFGK